MLIEENQHFIDLNADPKITDEARCLHTRMDLEVVGTHKGERSGVLVDEGWSASSTPTAYANTAAWSEWFYENGGFVKKSYGLSMITSGLTITPDSNSPSAEYNGSWKMKSGYGYSLNWNPAVTSVRGRLAPVSDMYTSIQNSCAMLPEFNYSTVYKQYRTLKATTDGYGFAPNTAANNARLHFIPVWYPNENYAVSAYAYDCWTPAGMIGARVNSNTITINGSLYDDYYVGRN